MTPESVKDLRGDAFWRECVLDDVREYLAQYELTKNGIFAWRAWRAARLLGDISPQILRAFLPYLDECAERLMFADNAAAAAQAIRFSNPLQAGGEGKAAAEKQKDDYLLLREFMYLTERPRRPLTKAKAYRLLQVSRDAPSVGAIKQRLLRIMGAGQYARRKRSTK
jgi:hypothetical protein